MCEKCIRNVKYHVYCSDDGYAFSEELEVELTDDQRLSDVIVDYADDVITDAFQSVIEKAMEQYEPEADGFFDIYDITAELYIRADDYIASVASNIHIFADEIDTNGQVASHMELDAVKILQSLIELRPACEMGYIDAGGCVEQSLVKFVAEGSWHFGLKADDRIICDKKEWPAPRDENGKTIWDKNGEDLLPIFWFGISGKAPIPIWTIDCNMPENSIAFWFEQHRGYVLEPLLSDPDEGFLIWYLMECGRFVPEVDEIREGCPIDFSADDSADMIARKINDFFVEQYRLSRADE